MGKTIKYDANEYDNYRDFEQAKKQKQREIEEREWVEEQD